MRLTSYLAPALLPLYGAVGEHLADRLGEPVEVTQAPSWVEPAYDAFADGEADLAFICGLPYVRLRQRRPHVEPLVAPVPSGARYADRPRYYSMVLVPAGASGRSLEDLRGARWGYNEPGSHSGVGVVAAELRRRGLTWDHFGEVVGMGTHQRVVRALRQGDLDGAAVDSHLLDVLVARDPDLAADLSVIEVLGPSPIQPLVAAPHLPAERREQVRRALTEIAEHAALATALLEAAVTRFALVGDADYDPIRAMATSAGPLLSDTGPARRHQGVAR